MDKQEVTSTEMERQILNDLTPMQSVKKLRKKGMGQSPVETKPGIHSGTCGLRH